jgi:hypothetical protein
MQLKTLWGSKVTFLRNSRHKGIVWVDCELGPNHILIDDLDEESKGKLVNCGDSLENKEIAAPTE